MTSADHVILEGDCLNLLPSIPTASVDLLIADLPYGTTYANWDRVLPLDRLWPEILRVTKPKAPLLFFASNPFSSFLVSSQPDLYRTEWVWNKGMGANFANAHRHPLKVHENILVFATGQSPYFPQKTVDRSLTEAQFRSKLGKHSTPRRSATQKMEAPRNLDFDKDSEGYRLKFPKSILDFPKHSSQGRDFPHPTQKPVALIEYLLRTYSVEGDVVLDPTCGSGTTGIAALLTSRKSIQMEKESRYVVMSRARLDAERPKT